MTSTNLPKDWKNVPINEVLSDVQYGTSKIDEYPQDINIVGMKDIINGKIYNRNLKSVSVSESDKQKLELSYGDILLNRTNSYDLVGKVGIYLSYEPAVFASYLVRLVTHKDKINSFFLNFYLNLDETQSSLKKIATKAVSQANINPTQFRKKCLILLPPLPEQQKIAEILTTWDTAINTTEKLLEIQKNKKKSLMQKLLTQKVRLKGFSGKWEEKKLGEVCKIQRGDTITKELVGDGEIPVMAGGKTYAYFHNKSNRKPPVITISASGASAGYISYHTQEIFASDCSTIISGKTYNIKWLYFVLLNLQKIIYKLQAGGAQPHIHPSTLSPLFIPLPPLPEQEAIAEILSKADQLLSACETKLANLKTQKKALMQVLLTGKIRVQLN